MKKIFLFSQAYLALFLMLFFIACQSQQQPILSENNDSELSCDSQISAYVNSIFQDKKGDFWFGTHGHGVCRYDRDTFAYFSIQEGFGGVTVRGMVEDEKGNIWFATTGGITQYAPSTQPGAAAESFTNFTEKEGLIHNDVRSIAIDRQGIIWIGTLEGLSRFDPQAEHREGAKMFTTVDIPAARLDYSKRISSAKIVHCIMEDSKGKMWFGTNGGAYIFDPAAVPAKDGSLKPEEISLSHISEKDGLCSNAVRTMAEDKEGNIWFGTHSQGISKYDGKSFTNFTQDGAVEGNEVWSIYEDKTGNIWFSAVGYGVYRYEPAAGSESFTQFYEEEGLSSHALHCIYEDKEGQLWLGGWKGVFRFDGNSFSPVTKINIFSHESQG